MYTYTRVYLLIGLIVKEKQKQQAWFKDPQMVSAPCSLASTLCGRATGILEGNNLQKRSGRRDGCCLRPSKAGREKRIKSPGLASWPVPERDSSYTSQTG